MISEMYYRKGSKRYGIMKIMCPVAGWWHRRRIKASGVKPYVPGAGPQDTLVDCRLRIEDKN